MDKIKWLLSDFKRENDYDMISHVMLAMGKTFLEQGGNLLIEQAFWKKEYVQPYLNLATEFKADLHFYQLVAPIDVLRKRASERPNTPNKPPVTTERIEKNLKTWKDNRYELGKTIDTTEFSVEEIVNSIIKDLEPQD